jgi:hypothetical protein
MSVAVPVFEIELHVPSPGREPELLQDVELHEVPSDGQILRVREQTLIVRRVDEFGPNDITGLDGFIVADAAG